MRLLNGKSILDCDEQGINDSVVLGFNIYFESVKKMTNGDILAAIISDAKASANFTKIQKVQITNDKSAQKVNLSDSDYLEIFPLTHTDVKRFCLENISEFKANQVFNRHMKKIKENNKLAYCRKLDPKDKNGKWFYSKDVLKELKNIYCTVDTTSIQL